MSREGFLRRGETREVLKVAGNVPELIERLTMLRMVGQIEEEMVLRRVVGMGSRSQYAFEDCDKSEDISSSEEGRKEENVGGMVLGGK